MTINFDDIEEAIMPLINQANDNDTYFDDISMDDFLALMRTRLITAKMSRVKWQEEHPNSIQRLVSFMSYLKDNY